MSKAWCRFGAVTTEGGGLTYARWHIQAGDPAAEDSSLGRRSWARDCSPTGPAGSARAQRRTWPTCGFGAAFAAQWVRGPERRTTAAMGAQPAAREGRWVAAEWRPWRYRMMLGNGTAGLVAMEVEMEVGCEVRGASWRRGIVIAGRPLLALACAPQARRSLSALCCALSSTASGGLQNLRSDRCCSTRMLLTRRAHATSRNGTFAGVPD